MPLVTRAEAARLLGVSAAAVYQACKAGRITTVTSVTGEPRINSETVLAEWRRNTRGRVNGPRDLRSPSEIAGTPKPLRPAADRMSAGTSRRISATREAVPDYDESRARTEHLKAELLELERQQKLGALIPVAEVQAKWVQLVTTARTKLLGLPSKAKQHIPDLDLDAINTLDTLVRQCLDDLADAATPDDTEDDA